MRKGARLNAAKRILVFANLTRRTSSPKIIALQKACQFPRKIQHGCVLGSRIKAEESVLLCHHKVPEHGTPSTRRSINALVTHAIS
jgi:hypothetical protein